MQTENIALIELGGSHDECLYSQVIFLKKYGYRVHVLLFANHMERIQAWPEVDCWQTWPEPVSWPGEWRTVIRVLKYLHRNGIRRAVINTAEGNIIRKLTIASGRDIEYTGLIHLARKLWTSRSQRIISRKIKKYLVLAEFIKENLATADPSLSIEYFYPVYFPGTQPGKATEIESGDTKETKTRDSGVIKTNGSPENETGDSTGNKTNGSPEINRKDFLVCIPGAVDYARRDYRSLLDELKMEGIPGNMRFVLLGRTSGPDGQDLRSRIQREGLEGHFLTFRDFIAPGRFHGYLSLSDLILPLITPDSGDYADYLKYKITGTYNLAWGFQKPMLMHDSFEGFPIFRNTSEFYRSGNLLQTLKELSALKEDLKKLGKKISGLKDFNLEEQAEKYVNFLRQ